MVKASIKIGAIFSLTAGYIIALVEFKALTTTHSLSNRTLVELGIENLVCPIAIYILLLVFLGITVSFLISIVLRTAGFSWFDRLTSTLGFVIFLPSWYYSTKVQAAVTAHAGESGFTGYLKTYLVITCFFICFYLLLVRLTPPPAAKQAGRTHTGGRILWMVYLVLMAAFPFFLLHGLVAESLPDFKREKTPSSYLSAGRPGINVLLITIDTLRQDYLGCYNPGAVRTPEIDAIALESVRFENVFATAPLTLPSHASILTGDYPKTHGVRTNIRNRVLDSAELTLTEILRDNGYKTAAFVGATVINRNSGLDQGFDLYGDTFDHMWYQLFKQGRQLLPKTLIRLKLMKKSNLLIRKGEEVSDKAIEWLHNNGEDRFFLWLHYFDPHKPYRPPLEFVNMNLEDPARKIDHSDQAITDIALYKGEVSYTDFHVGRIFQTLREMGLMETTLIIITADHGQSLGEHDYHGHTQIIYEQTMRIPLILRLPGRTNRGRVVSQLVSNVDITPTVLDVLSIPWNNEFDGSSFYPSIHEDEYRAHDMVFLETLHGEKEGKALVGVRDLNWKLIQARPDLSIELFDLGVDSAETFNLADSNAAVVDSLSTALNRFFDFEEAFRDTEDQELEPDLEENLRALGYIGDS